MKSTRTRVAFPYGCCTLAQILRRLCVARRDSRRLRLKLSRFAPLCRGATRVEKNPCQVEKRHGFFRPRFRFYPPRFSRTLSQPPHYSTAAGPAALRQQNPRLLWRIAIPSPPAPVPRQPRGTNRTEPPPLQGGDARSSCALRRTLRLSLRVTPQRAAFTWRVNAAAPALLTQGFQPGRCLSAGACTRSDCRSHATGFTFRQGAHVTHYPCPLRCSTCNGNQPLILRRCGYG